MPDIDWIPGLSQLKSLAQVIAGDTEAAKRTVTNFCRKCPGVSQVTSVVQLAAGDTEGASETQKICLSTISNVANGIPVIGHAKGIVHHVVGDHEGRNQAFNAANRSSVIVKNVIFAGICVILKLILQIYTIYNIYITKDTRQQAQQKLHERDKQRPEGNILELYKDVKFTTHEILSGLLTNINKDRNHIPNNKLNECVCQLLELSLLFLIMPKEFPYTVVVQLNNCRSGLYHSFIRHIHDWAQVIPSDFSQVIYCLSPLMPEIQLVASTNNKHGAPEALNKFVEARKRLSRGIYNDTQIAFVEIQMLMHRFLQENITFDNYLGRGTNRKGLERPYYKVKTKTGRRVMVIGLSERRFKPSRGDKRPIRQLITAYFESWEVFKSHGMLETKEEMQKRTR